MNRWIYAFPIVIYSEVTLQILPRPFRLYNELLHKKDFKEIVQNSWNQSINGHTMYSVWSKLKLIEQQARHEQGNDSAGQEGWNIARPTCNSLGTITEWSIQPWAN